MLDRVIAVWRRRKWTALLAFAAPFSIVVGLVTSLPNIYRSTATVVVERQQVPEAFVRPTVTGEVETRFQVISQEIFNRSTLETLVQRFQLYSRLRGSLTPEALVARLRNDIIVTMKSDPGASGGNKMVAFSVSYRGGDPRTVAEVTNTLAALFMDENLRLRATQASGTASFLQAQLSEATAKLDEQERRVSEYSRRYMGQLPQQLSTNLSAIEQLSAQLRLNNDRQTMTAARREALERQLADVETMVPSAAAAAPAAADTPALRLLRLRRELRDLRTQYTEKYPEVMRVKAELDALERELGGTAEAPAPAVVASSMDPAARRIKAALTEVDAEIKGLRADEKRLRSTIGDYQGRVDATPRREQEFQELSRDYQTTKEHYQLLLKRFQEARLAEDMEQRRKGEQFRVVEPAVEADRPAAPNRRRLLLVGLALSIALGVGLAVAVEQFDTSFHSVDDLRAFTRVPVLVSIPLLLMAADVRQHRRRFRLAAALALVVVALLGVGTHLAGRGNAVLVSLVSPGAS